MSTGGVGGAGERRQEIAGALDSVRRRMAEAATAAGRDPVDVRLIAVTKTRPAADVVALAALGIRDIGESRDQEASAKVADVRAELGEERAGELRWHFVGRLQSRKCRSVASYATAVHSLDRAELVAKLADGVQRAHRPPLEVFVQVSLDGDPDRGGVALDALDALTDDVAARADHLTLRGVMAVPPLGSDPDVEFARLAGIAERVRERHPGADAISAGMSEDLVPAIAHGATHVRVGTALLGQRPPLLG